MRVAKRLSCEQRDLALEQKNLKHGLSVMLSTYRASLSGRLLNSDRKAYISESGTLT